MGTKETPESLFARAYAHHQAGRIDDAAVLYRTLLEIQPRNADALHLMGLIAMQRRDLDSARQLISSALAQYPDHPIALNSLGEVLRLAGAYGESEPLLRRALALAPANTDVMNNLGALLAETGRLGEAVSSIRDACARQPRNPAYLANLGRVLAQDGQPEAALAAYDEALRLRPNWNDAANPSALLLKNLGRVREATVRLEACLAASGDLIAAGNLLLTYCYDIDLTPEQLLARHREVAARVGLARQPDVQCKPQAGRTPGQPLRIGFVSGDFREHPIAYFLLPLLRGLKTIGNECFAYGWASREDRRTDEIRGLCTRFERIEQWSVDQVVQGIRDDAIDVLVDLSGHTGNRLSVFVQRAAPVQVNWLGYLASTGLDCFDAHLADELAVPPAMGRAAFSEPIAYLPGCQWCYSPPLDRAPALPRSGSPFVFGAFHNVAKLNRQVLSAWTRILADAPETRLVVMAQGARALREALIETGGAKLARRIEVRPAGSMESYLQAHEDVDCVLDSFPYCGGTTTFHALWMATPVLTLTSDHPAGRGGASILARIGLSDWIATSVDDYVERAVAWSRRREELATLRRGLRQRMEASSLMDETEFARGFVATVAALRVPPERRR